MFHLSSVGWSPFNFWNLACWNLLTIKLLFENELHYLPLVGHMWWYAVSVES